MEKIPHMIDMAMSSPDSPMPEATNLHVVPQYPYGLTLCLNDQTLDKLNMEGDCEVGDHVHFHCLAKVTSASDHENMGKRIELQIVAMSAENEEYENEEAEEDMPKRALDPNKMYGK